MLPALPGYSLYRYKTDLLGNHPAPSLGQLTFSACLAMLGRCTVQYVALSLPSTYDADGPRRPRTSATPERAQPVPAVTNPLSTNLYGGPPLLETSATPERTQPVPAAMLLQTMLFLLTIRHRFVLPFLLGRHRSRRQLARAVAAVIVSGYFLAVRPFQAPLFLHPLLAKLASY